MKASIIIPAYNEERSIAKTLKSLQNQDFDEEFEVIVVDNNSTDKTSEVAKGFAKKLNLRVILEKKKGRGTARATGNSAAKGEILISTDADTWLPKHWLKAITKPFGDPKVVAVTGPWRLFDLDKEAKYWLERLQKIAELPFRLIYGHYWLTGFNMALRKTAYDKCGGFNPDINAHEDIDITMRIRKLGKIVYADDAVAHQSGRRYRKGAFRGVLEYDILAVRYFLFGDDKIVLDDKR